MQQPHQLIGEPAIVQRDAVGPELADQSAGMVGDLLEGGGSAERLKAPSGRFRAGCALRQDAGRGADALAGTVHGLASGLLMERVQGQGGMCGALVDGRLVSVARRERDPLEGELPQVGDGADRLADTSTQPRQGGDGGRPTFR